MKTDFISIEVLIDKIKDMNIHLLTKSELLKVVQIVANDKK